MRNRNRSAALDAFQAPGRQDAGAGTHFLNQDYLANTFSSDAEENLIT